MTHDFTTATHDLKTRHIDGVPGGLHVVTVSQTPLGEEHSALLVHPDTDPHSNKALHQALQMYGKYYLATQDGIPGEGEDISVILSRLNGEDPLVKAITVYGTADNDGKLHGMAFVETYIVDMPVKSGIPTQGMVHLITYAASDPQHDDYAHNAAFHAGIIEKIKETDSKLKEELGISTESIVTAEVNATQDFEGNRTSNKMDGEFEIKTGAYRKDRDAYQLGRKPGIIGLDGLYGKSNILGVTYTPPALGGEESESLAHITSASELAEHLKNHEIFNGEGEPLFLVAESLDGNKLTAEQMGLEKAFQKQLVVSVTGDRGVTDAKLILDARGLAKAGFGSMDHGLDSLERQLSGAHVARTGKVRAPTED